MSINTTRLLSFLLLLLLNIAGTVHSDSVAVGPDVTVKALRLFVGSDEYFIKGMGYSPSPAALQVENTLTGVGYCSPHNFIQLGTYTTLQSISPCYFQDFFDGSEYPSGPVGGWSAVWKRDFPLIKSLGVNTVRIYHAYPVTSLAIRNSPNYLQTAVGANHIPFLDLAASYGLKVIFPLYAAETAVQGAISVDFVHEYIRNLIDEVGYHPAVLMFEFGNELQFINNGDAYRQKVADFINYARAYQNSRWGRSLPFISTLIDIPQLYSTLSLLPIDIVATNAGYRGFTFSDLWDGAPGVGFPGFRQISCQLGKPLLIGEMGVHHDSTYFDVANWFPTMWGDIIAHKTQGAIGGFFFEWQEEHWKGVAYAGQNWQILPDVYMGLVIPQPAGNSTQLYGFTVDTVAKKFAGAYNWNSVTTGFAQDPFAEDSKKTLATATNAFCPVGSPLYPTVGSGTTAASISTTTTTSTATSSNPTTTTTTGSSSTSGGSSTTTTGSSSGLCGTNNCGASSCCPDKRNGQMCYQASNYVCAKDKYNGNNYYLCPLGNGACNGACYATASYSCVNGQLSATPESSTSKVSTSAVASSSTTSTSSTSSKPTTSTSTSSKLTTTSTSKQTSTSTSSKSTSTTSTTGKSTATTTTTGASSAPVCVNTVCASGLSCCPDHSHGNMCYSAADYDCVVDAYNRYAYLCGKGDGSCNGACFDDNSYTCSNGSLVQK